MLLKHYSQCLISAQIIGSLVNFLSGGDSVKSSIIKSWSVLLLNTHTKKLAKCNRWAWIAPSCILQNLVQTLHKKCKAGSEALFPLPHLYTWTIENLSVMKSLESNFRFCLEWVSSLHRRTIVNMTEDFFHFWACILILTDMTLWPFCHSPLTKLLDPTDLKSTLSSLYTTV